jgi:ATP-dependent Clp protease ATP-binding subunit ClpA
LPQDEKQLVLIEPGAGKTAIVEGLAEDFDGDVPPFLAEK